MSTEPQYNADHRARLRESIEASLQPCQTPEAVEKEINRRVDYLANRTHDAMDNLCGQIMENKMALEQLERRSEALVETLETRTEIQQQTESSHRDGNAFWN